MSIRTERLASVIQKDLGMILQQSYQPSGCFITVTQVRVTADLSIAKVYLSVFTQDRDPQTIYQYIDDNQDQIRYELASKIKNQVRRIPELLFFEDDTAEYVNKMEQLFAKVRKQRKDADNSDA
jgi:ribosome-binding factor A